MQSIKPLFLVIPTTSSLQSLQFIDESIISNMILNYILTPRYRKEKIQGTFFIMMYSILVPLNKTHTLSSSQSSSIIHAELMKTRPIHTKSEERIISGKEQEILVM